MVGVAFSFSVALLSFLLLTTVTTVHCPSRAPLPPLAHRLPCIARSLFLYVACPSPTASTPATVYRPLSLYLARLPFPLYSGYRCIVCSLFRSVARLSFYCYCGYRCIARSLSPVARRPLPATPAVYCTLFLSPLLRVSLPLLDILATGALLALFRSVARLPLLATPALVLPALFLYVARL